MEPVHISDQLVERCKSGDRRAQCELYRKYSKAMFNVCTRMLVRIEDAEDALQETFLDAFRNIDQFRRDATFGSWIRQITIHKCINIAKRKQFNFEQMKEYPGAQEAVFNEVQDEITPSMVQQAVKMLPDGCRVIFTLHNLEGYDHGEIASILKISESTSKSQLHRAKQLLQHHLKKSRYVG